MGIRKKQNELSVKSWKLINVLHDMELKVSESLFHEIVDLYKEGHSVEVIGRSVNRCPDEIFIILFHAVRQGIELKEFAVRVK